MDLPPAALVGDVGSGAGRNGSPSGRAASNARRSDDSASSEESRATTGCRSRAATAVMSSVIFA